MKLQCDPKQDEPMNARGGHVHLLNLATSLLSACNFKTGRLDHLVVWEHLDSKPPGRHHGPLNIVETLAD